MTTEGKVISSKYDKFRQINRFLEFVNDILPSVMKSITVNNEQIRPLRIADFGCGKSYLTFAVHYFVTQIKKIDAEIIGLDLKKEVIDLETLLLYYFKVIDPTTYHRQGNDIGSQYRTGIYYVNDNDLDIINKVVADQQKSYKEEIVVEKFR